MKRKDILWLIFLRLIIITSLVISAVTIQYHTETFLSLDLFYYLILAAYFLSMVYLILYHFGKFFSFQVHLQIFFDLLLITILVYMSGGIRGSFYFLYIFEIIAASLVISTRAAYITAALSASFFGFLIDGMYLGIIPYRESWPEMQISLEDVLINIILALGVFFLVAFFMNYLTGAIRRTRDELKNAQKELEIRKNLAVAGEVSAQLAHEIRNPLTAISGSVQVLRNELALSGEQQNLMEIVVQESKRVSQSIEQFLNLASPSKQVLTDIELSRILKETLILLQRSGELNGNCQVEGNYDSKKVHYYGNSNQFKQVFWNLIKNSVKAMPEGGKLIIDFDQGKNNEVRLKFADTGIGMDEEVKKRLFEPFYSGFETGKGIGMSIVRRVISDYRGQIQVKSEVNKGTEIVITLPGRPQMRKEK